MVDFPQGKKAVSNTAVIMSRKVARTITSTNDFSQCRSCNESDMFLKTLG